MNKKAIILKLPQEKKVKSFGNTSSISHVQTVYSTPYFIELMTVKKEFKNESDRGLIIISCSIIDELLNKLIEAKFLKMSNKDEMLLKSTQPLSSFSSRIEVSYRVGLISKELRRDLNALRKIRNDFAHGFRKHKLSEKNISDSIKLILSHCPYISHNLKSTKDGSSERVIIETFISSVIVTLNNKIEKCFRFEEAKAEEFLYGKI